MAGCTAPALPVALPAPMATSVPVSVRTVEPQARAAAACHERAGLVQGWLREVDELGWPLGSSLLDGGTRLVVRSGSALDEPAPVIHITASEQALDGVRTADLSSLGDRLADVFELRRRTIESSPFVANPRVYIALDADVAWARVAEVVERVVGAGAERAAFVFLDEGRAALPLPPSTIDLDLAKLAHASVSKRGQILAEALAFVYKDCQSALHLIAQFGQDVPEVQQALVEQLPAALEACGCAVDDASVRALHWALFGNPRPGSSVTLSLARPSTPGARALKAGANVRWQDAHELIFSMGNAAASRVIFAVDTPLASEAVPLPGLAPAKSTTRGKRP